MVININDIDTEELDELALNNLCEAISGVDFNNGYTRADLERIESILPGSFSDLEDFSFIELPTAPSLTKAALISRQLELITDSIKNTLDNRYDSYIVMFGELSHKLQEILRLLEKTNERVPNLVVPDISLLYLYSNSWDSKCLTDISFGIEFKKLNNIQFAELRDPSLNNNILNLNLALSLTLGLVDDEADATYNYSILKQCLGKSIITYDMVNSVFSNPTELVKLCQTTLDSLLTVVVDLKDELRYTFLSDQNKSRYVSNTAKLNTFRSMAMDYSSLQLLQIVAAIRYNGIFNNDN